MYQSVECRLAFGLNAEALEELYFGVCYVQDEGICDVFPKMDMLRYVV